MCVFMEMLSGARPYVTVQSCKNQFYSDLVTPLPDVRSTSREQRFTVFMRAQMNGERYERHSCKTQPFMSRTCSTRSRWPVIRSAGWRRIS